MEPAQVLAALRRSWWLVVVAALLGLAGAAVANASTPRLYRADVQQFVSFADQSDSSANVLSGSQFTLQRVKSYTQVATSAQVLEPVIHDLRLPMTTSSLAAEIQATNPLDTVLIDIAVTDTDPRRAARLANAIAARFGLVVADLERPPGGGDSPVKVSVTEPAAVPGAPVSPRVNLNLALGLLAGIALGVGGALLRARLDTTVKGIEDVAATLGSVPLGTVPADPRAPSHPLVLHDQRGARAEAFRTLRTNLQFADVDAPPRSIVVTSAMPGEGKTTTACNLALALAIGGSRVVLVEADLRRPQACEYLDLEPAAGLTTVLAGRATLDDVLVGWHRELMHVLPAGPIPPNPAELLGSQHMGSLLRVLESRFDHVILDTAPLLPVTDAAVLAAAADGAIIVIRHRRTTHEQVVRAAHALASVKGRLLGSVVTMVPRGRRAYGYSYGYGSDNVQAPVPSEVSAPMPPSRPGRRPDVQAEVPAELDESPRLLDVPAVPDVGDVRSVREVRDVPGGPDAGGVPEFAGAAAVPAGSPTLLAAVPAQASPGGERPAADEPRRARRAERMAEHPPERPPDRSSERPAERDRVLDLSAARDERRPTPSRVPPRTPPSTPPEGTPRPASGRHRRA